jgi:uncharacterized protein (TIGR02271 family)
MASTQTRRAIGTFPTRREAEQALHELERSGFPMDKVSVIARDDRTDRLAGANVSEPVGNKADDGAKTGAVSGGALGGLTGLLVGLGVLAIPGIGPVMLAGAGATVLATALSGTAIGAAAGGLLGALVGLGIPEKEAKVYSDRVSRGDYLVMVQGTDADVQHAEQVLKRHTIQDWGIYNVTDASHTQTVEQARPVAAPIAQPSSTVNTPVRSATESESVRLYEEQLRVGKTRQKAGEVTVSKHVETETARVAVPVEKERIVVRRISSEIGKAVASSDADFREGEVLRMEAYEETPNIQKQAFVREEVSLRKEVKQEVVNAEETVRREELDVTIQGHPRVDAPVDFPSDRP